MKKNSMLLGYYICKYEECPLFLSDISKRILSASACLCTHEPQIVCCHGWKPNGDKKEYIESLHLNVDQYIKMSSEINVLFDKDLFSIDGRFLNYDEAKYFMNEYFNSPDYKLIAITMDEKYNNLLGDDWPVNKGKQLVGIHRQIGCDIIGWDISGFHSFLCNSLQENYPQLKFNEYCLVNEEYSVVEKIANEIQGQGEPVDWIPVEIFMCD